MRLNRLLVIAFVVSCLAASLPRAYCQAENGPTEIDEVPKFFEPQTQELKEASDKLREHLVKMREIMVRYNLGAKEEDLKWKAEWDALREVGVPLHRQLVDAALAEYRANTSVKSEVGEMLMRILKRNVDADRFEEMDRVAQALIEGNYPLLELEYYLAISAFALGNYDVAEPSLAKLVANGMAVGQLLEIYENFAQLRDDWKEELRLREEDAQGEPLPRVLMKTSKGNMEIELFENQAPETVGNFISLVEAGFYDHLTFHRVLKHFMAQGGCPDGDGRGGPGYSIYGEMQKPNARKFFRGTLGVALADNPNSGGSQFFITFLPTPSLDGNYVAFGRVISGIDVLASINKINPEEKDEDESEPAEMPDEIISIEVLSKRDHVYEPNKVK